MTELDEKKKIPDDNQTISFKITEEPAPRRGWKKRDKIILTIVMLLVLFAIIYGPKIYLVIEWLNI